jgi:DNA-directed RNA polymerase IV subunit 1
MQSLNSAICDTGKTVLPEHIVLTADCLAATGEFVALNARGLAQQRKGTAVAAPLNQACFSVSSQLDSCLIALIYNCSSNQK